MGGGAGVIDLGFASSHETNSVTPVSLTVLQATRCPGLLEFLRSYLRSKMAYDTAHRASFFSLPGEIRNQIYANFFYAHTKHVRDFKEDHLDKGAFDDYRFAWAMMI
jgi:hypothetical protein